ncbi:MAG: cobalamin-binding protein [Anaerolineaceae bacterium]|nr:MAG: cobalamin-binding protein [Anaerolineaceae bacterium]
MLRKLLFVTLLAALTLAACAPAVPSKGEAGIVVTDGLGREVKLESAAQRVVSLAPSNTEILFALGAGDKVVGRDEVSDYPEAALALPTVGGWSGFSAEAIVALEPDLVLAAEINSPELVSELEGLGLTVYYLSNPKTLEDLYVNIEIIATLTGRDATKLTDSLKARVAAVDEKIAPLSYRPSVFYEVDATDPSKPYTVGPGTFIDLLIQRAGGQNVVSLAGVTDSYPQIGLEQLVLTPPEIILLGDALYGQSAETVAARQGWDSLTAVIDGKVFPFDDNLVSRPGPRLIDGLEALAMLLHPEVFE